MIDETMTYEGHFYVLLPDSYETEVCDICGRRRKCDYWESDNGFWDICRSCLSRMKTGETEGSMTGRKG